LALSVWRVDSAAFVGFHDWLCEQSRTAAEARLEAERRVDPQRLRAQLAGSTIGQFLARHVMIYQKAGKGTLPKVFSEKITVSGRTNSVESLCNTLQANHGLTRQR
jgi:hypothetical protein